MGFPGTWMTESESLVYRVVPKCACSTIGQILHRAGTGAFFDGDIHDAREGVWKWNGHAEEGRAREAIRRAVLGGGFRFTAVRNPYARLLSAFFDKICGVQRNGRRYRGTLMSGLCESYGIRIEPGFDQIAAFRRFVLLARDTVRFQQPIPPDIHWAPMASHAATLVRGGGRFDAVFATEDFAAGMGAVLAARPPEHAVDLAALPRFNESAGHGPRPEHPLEAFYDDLAAHLVQETYRRDFAIFKYRRQPGREGPRAPLDPAEVTARLAR